MPNFDAISGQLVQADQALNLDELAQALNANISIVVEMVEYNLLIPHGSEAKNWSFDSHSLKRAQRALRFKQDLALNMEGISLALDLLDQIDQLETQLNILRRYMG